MLALAIHFVFFAAPVAPENKLGRAIALCADAQFEAAIPALEELLYPLRIAKDEVARARFALAQAYYFTEHTEKARRELQLLFKKNPSFHTNAKAFPPDFISFYEQTRSESAEDKPHVRVMASPSAPAQAPTVSAPQSRPPPRTQSQPATQASPAPRAVSPVMVHATSPSASWYLKLIPFGVGQFVNHDPLGGGVFLGLGIVTIGANIALSIYNGSKRLPSGDYPMNAGYPALYIMQDVTAGAAITVAIIGIVDAFMWSPARAAARHEPALQLGGSVSTTSATVAMSGAF